MKNLFTFLFAAICFSNAIATNVGGGIYTSTTWSANLSPYIVTGDIVIFDDATLTIEPGVEVLVDNNIKIEVRGRMEVLGTANALVNIHGNTTTNDKNYWPGIVFIGTSTVGSGAQANFKYCIVSNANACFNFDLAYEGPYNFRNCTFSYNGVVNKDGGMGGMLFDSCTITYNDKGFSYFQFENSLISNCFFDNNKIGVDGAGPLLNCKFTNHSDFAINPYGSTRNCEITNNNIGVKTAFNSANSLFVDNKVKNNGTGLEIGNYFNGYINFTNNEICDNSGHNVILLAANPCDLSNNCWCTTDSAAIRSKIYDGYNDIARGLVDYSPYKSACPVTSIPNPNPAPGSSTGTELKMYPNPGKTDEAISIDLSEGNDIQAVQVVNITGSVVGYQLSKRSQSSYSLKLNHTIQGIYFINFKLANGQQITRKAVLY